MARWTLIGKSGNRRVRSAHALVSDQQEVINAMSDMKAEPSSEAPRVLKLLQEILSLHEAEVDCETCNQQIDCLAELVSVGHDPNKLLPAVQEHLDCCS